MNSSGKNTQVSSSPKTAVKVQNPPNQLPHSKDRNKEKAQVRSLHPRETSSSRVRDSHHKAQFRTCKCFCTCHPNDSRSASLEIIKINSICSGHLLKVSRCLVMHHYRFKGHHLNIERGFDPWHLLCYIGGRGSSVSLSGVLKV